MYDANTIDEHYRGGLRSEILGMAIALAFCLFCGFYHYSDLAGGEGVVDAIFVWALRIGAVGFIVCIVLAMMGMRVALLTDAVLCGGLAAVLMLTAAAWLVEGVIVTEAFMVGIAGVMAGGAAVRSWGEFSAWSQAVDGLVSPMPLAVEDRNESPATSPVPTVIPPSPASTAMPPATTVQATPSPVAERSPESQAPIDPLAAEPEAPSPEGGFLAELGREDD